MNESIKRYGSIIGVGVAAVIASRLIAPSAPAAPPLAMKTSKPKSADIIAVSQTRIVSCGDMRGAARVSGDDDSGTVMLGSGAGGNCTVLFAREAERTCTATGGVVAKLTGSDLVISKVTGGVATYRCSGR